MASYYVNKNQQSNGDYEVHKTGCSYMPNIGNAHYLGEFNSCEPAVQKAKQLGYYTADGCYFCCRPCHTS
jgi:hypothetical protein